MTLEGLHFVTVLTLPADHPKCHADFPAVTQFRASVCVLGPIDGTVLAARCGRPAGRGRDRVPPARYASGGVAATRRAQRNIKHGCVVARADVLQGARIRLDFPSVGATENILMAAVLAEGLSTVIDNAAREPDIVDLCMMLNRMGARVARGGDLHSHDSGGVPRLPPRPHTG